MGLYSAPRYWRFILTHPPGEVWIQTATDFLIENARDLQARQEILDNIYYVCKQTEKHKHKTRKDRKITYNLNMICNIWFPIWLSIPISWTWNWLLTDLYHNVIDTLSWLPVMVSKTDLCDCVCICCTVYLGVTVFFFYAIFHFLLYSLLSPFFFFIPEWSWSCFESMICRNYHVSM